MTVETRQTARGTLSVRVDPQAGPDREVWISVVKPDRSGADMIDISREDAQWLIAALKEVLR